MEHQSVAGKDPEERLSGISSNAPFSLLPRDTSYATEGLNPSTSESVFAISKTAAQILCIPTGTNCVAARRKTVRG
jgi:hypothetical protein